MITQRRLSLLWMPSFIGPMNLPLVHLSSSSLQLRMSSLAMALCLLQIMLSGTWKDLMKTWQSRLSSCVSNRVGKSRIGTLVRFPNSLRSTSSWGDEAKINEQIAVYARAHTMRGALDSDDMNTIPYSVPTMAVGSPTMQALTEQMAAMTLLVKSSLSGSKSASALSLTPYSCSVHSYGTGPLFWSLHLVRFGWGFSSFWLHAVHRCLENRKYQD